MRPLIDRLLRRGAKGRGSRPPRPSVLQRRRRQLYAAAAASGLALGLAVGGLWVREAGIVDWIGAKLAAAGTAATRAAGLTVREVYVVGRQRTERGELARALGLARGDSMLTFDPEAARRRLLALAWVKEARVYRRLPDIVEVTLRERQPLALWQHNGRLALIDGDGEEIAEPALARYAQLPLVVGAGAPASAADLLDTLRLEPALAAEVEAAVRVGGRRWDLRLRHGVVVKLPEGGARAGWSRLARLAAEHGLLRRDISVVDLRLPDRLVLRLSPAAAEKRRQPGKEA